MLSKPEKPAFSTGHRKIIAGITLFWAGVVCAIITIIMLVIGFYHLNSVEEGVLIYAGFIMLFIVFLMIVIGVTLYFIGRSQSKKQKNQKSL